MTTAATATIGTAGPYTITIEQYAADGVTVASTDTLTAYLPSKTDAPQMTRVTAWTSGSLVLYTPQAYLTAGGSWMRTETEFLGGYSAATIANPPTGSSYVPIATISNNAAVQQQYGNIALFSTPIEQREQFQIMALPVIEKSGGNTYTRQYKVGDAACQRLVIRSYGEKPVTATMVMEVAGMIYGVECNPDNFFFGYKDPAGAGRGMYVNRYAIEYPETQNVKYVVNGVTTNLGTCDDALYLPTTTTTLYSIWLNISYARDAAYPGWCVKVDTICYENNSTDGTKWYSVELAELRGTTLTQMHHGPIDIRGRWS